MVAHVRIAWDNMTVGEWDGVVRAAGRSTLTQTYAYAAAMLQAERQKSTVGLIEQDDRPIGVVLAVKRRAFGVVEQMSIERGPLLIPAAWQPDIVTGVFAALRTRFPPGLRRWTRFIPELPAGPEVFAMLEAMRFRRSPGPGYRTIWLDLAHDEATLRRRLDKKWRNQLGAAERHAAAGTLRIAVDPQARTLPELARRYLEDKAARGYHGPSGPLVVRLRNALWQGGGSVLVTAEVEDRLAAGILVLCHGQAATYQIGWTGLAGRRTNATNLCLWEAIRHLKAAGLRWFDLGGIEPLSAPGVTAFKRGLGGEEVELAGTWV